MKDKKIIEKQNELLKLTEDILVYESIGECSTKQWNEFSEKANKLKDEIASLKQGEQESKEPDQSDKKKGVWIRCTNCDGTGFEFKGKEQPTPQVSPKGAEEILRQHPKEFLKEYLGVTVMPKARIKLYANDIALLLQGYAEQYHKERTREELIKFASYNFKEALRVNYDIERIAEYVDDYLTK